jgi:hypothetical protein
MDNLQATMMDTEHFSPYRPDGKLYGFVCVVTGAQQPVGRAIVKELAGETIFSPLHTPHTLRPREFFIDLDIDGMFPGGKEPLLTSSSSWCGLYLWYVLALESSLPHLTFPSLR